MVVSRESREILNRFEWVLRHLDICDDLWSMWEEEYDARVGTTRDIVILLKKASPIW